MIFRSRPVGFSWQAFHPILPRPKGGDPAVHRLVCQRENAQVAEALRGRPEIQQWWTRVRIIIIIKNIVQDV